MHSLLCVGRIFKTFIFVLSLWVKIADERVLPKFISHHFQGFYDAKTRKIFSQSFLGPIIWYEFDIQIISLILRRRLLVGLVRHGQDTPIGPVGSLLYCLLGWTLILKNDVSDSFRGVIRSEKEHQRHNRSILLKNLVELHLCQLLGNVFDKNVAVLANICNFFFKPEGPALLSTDFKVSDFLAHLYKVFKLSTRYFHKTFEKLFFGVPVNDGHVV